MSEVSCRCPCTREVWLVKYLDHCWREMNPEEEWEAELDTPVYITTVGFVLREDDTLMHLLTDAANFTDAVKGHITVHTIVKSCIVEQKCLGKGKVFL